MTREITISSPSEMEDLGASFARNSKPGDVFALCGTLGAGKTHWTKGFVAALHLGTSATSPTFGIVNTYNQQQPVIHHFDFYRLKSPEELVNLGWDDYLDDNAIVICEWANLFSELMPANTTWLEFSHLGGDTRLVKITEQTTRS